jgi:hypothetical protein
LTHSPSSLRHNTTLLSGVVGMLIALPAPVHALGISAPQTRSALGQPLELLFPVNLGPNESLAVECVHADVLAGDAHIPPSLVTLRLEGANEASVHAVRLVSLTQVNEPIVTVTLSLGCPAKVTRQYVALVDPPSAVVATTLPPLPEVLPGQDVRSQSYSPALRAALDASDSKPEMLLAEPPASALTAPTVAAQAASAPTAKPKAAAPIRLAAAVAAGAAAAEGGASAPAAAVPRKSRKRSTPPHAPRAAQIADAGSAKPAAHKEVSRLHMDAAEPAEVSSSQIAVAASAPASAAPDAASAPLDPTAIRLAAMEDRLNELQRQNQEQQSKLLQVQAKLDAAQAERYQNPFVWVLGLLVLGFGGLSAYLWRSRQAARESWWNAERPVPSPISPTRPVAPAPAKAATGATDFMSPDSAMPASATSDELTAPLPLLAESVSRLQGLPPPPQVTVEYNVHQETVPAPITDPGAPVTVEELLDMQQQVEFFLVLGQADAAIELLRGRVDTGSSSALPYLKLMEIYQSQGDVTSFADLGKRFSERFNAVPPAWGGDMNEGKMLEAYGEVLAGVQKIWGDAAVSMALLQNLLTFGPEGDELQGFDLPAYRDLLLLYSLARDLSEHDVSGEEIDLFLPLDGGPRNAATGMMATMSWSRNTAPAQLDVDVDISLDEPAPHDEATPTDFQPPDKI